MSLDAIIEKIKATIIDEVVKGSKFLKPKGLIERISDSANIDLLSTKQALGRLSKSGWLTGISHEGFPFGQVKVLGDIPLKLEDPLLTLWKELMSSEGLTVEEIKAMIPCYKKLQGLSLQELKSIINGLKKLKTEQFSLIGQPAFLISARYFLGSSKLLEELPSRSLMSFGIDISRFSQHPPYVVVAGCTNPKTVILVENPASFELAISTRAIETCAFISTFGFGLSHNNSEHGSQLATIVESGFSKAVTLTRQGSKPISVQELLSHSNITFWGDLDTAGIKIYLRLKSKIPNLQLSALYKPMLEALKFTENSHPYVDITKKPGQIDMKVSCEDLHGNMLLDLVKYRGVDQEFVSAELITDLAIGVL